MKPILGDVGVAAFHPWGRVAGCSPWQGGGSGVGGTLDAWGEEAVAAAAAGGDDDGD